MGSGGSGQGLYHCHAPSSSLWTLGRGSTTKLHPQLVFLSFILRQGLTKFPGLTLNLGISSLSLLTEIAGLHHVLASKFFQTCDVSMNQIQI